MWVLGIVRLLERRSEHWCSMIGLDDLEVLLQTKRFYDLIKPTGDLLAMHLDAVVMVCTEKSRLVLTLVLKMLITAECFIL